jgi:hypothetical protein
MQAMNEPDKPSDTEPIEPLWLAEFFCWTMVVLAPAFTR